MAAQKAKIISAASNGYDAPVPVSDPDDFPLPIDGEITVELSTGRVIRMVIGELEMFYAAGEIPDELTRIAARELTVPEPDDDKERERRYRERLRLRDWLVGRVLVAPKLDVDALYQNERWQIYNMANSPALALENFRRQQARHVGVVSAVQDVETATKPATQVEATAE
jgi:hypothetical protein